jgi:hypothetical protein
MKTADSKVFATVGAAALSVALIVGIDVFTNSVDTQAFTSDFLYYMAMARDGFHTAGASPFAYRYVTPMIVHELSSLLGVSIYAGFRSIAYVGAFCQLFGVFLFTNWFTHSIKGAYVALVVTASSLFNVKFLFFDVYRPDHLAYALILLQTYLAFRRKFVPLLLVTMVASQIREFNIIPLIAYLVSFLRDSNRSTVFKQVAFSVLGLAAAVGLPRLLIPVAENFQFADLSIDGLLRVLIAPLVLSRDANFVYTLIAYLLPVLMVAGLTEIRSVLAALAVEVRYFLFIYSGLVLAFCFLGGTDFSRFVTYFFMPQALMLGFLVPRRPRLDVAVMLVCTFLFNRIWLPFPSGPGESYVDLYGGYSTRFNLASILRALECIAFIVLGVGLRRLHRSGGPQAKLAIQ